MLDTIRTVAVQVAATVGFGAVFGWGGLGRFIVDGFASYDYPQLLGGAILIAVFALVVDLAFGLVGRLPAVRRVRV
jgi:osmoprotectant transport system permease protein